MRLTVLPVDNGPLSAGKSVRNVATDSRKALSLYVRSQIGLRADQGRPRTR